MSSLKELYRKFSLEDQNHKYELKLIEGVQKNIFFDSLTDLEKVDFRIRELKIKQAFKDIYSESIIAYEKLIIELTIAIINFLNITTGDLFQIEKDNSFDVSKLCFIRFKYIPETCSISSEKFIFSFISSFHTEFFNFINSLSSKEFHHHSFSQSFRPDFRK